MQTIKSNIYSESIVQNSKFLLYLEKVERREDVTKRIKELKEEHSSANHVCSAFRVIGSATPQPEVGFDDDGEPNGSAGRPMLAPIEGRGLINVAAYIVRYFGGTKLGVGGLVRAYGGLVSDTLSEESLLEEYIERQLYRFELGYGQNDKVQHFLVKNNMEVIESSFTDIVTLTIKLSKDEHAFFIETFNREVLEL